MTETVHEKAVLRDLGDGLVMRSAVPEDTEPLAAFNADLHREQGAPEPDEWIAVWTRNMMNGKHPTVKVSDNIVVEDTRTGAIVSTLNLISQTWTYAGIPFGVGRPELVGTHLDYRNRGLVRAQIEEMHRWSAERGELVQAITGIRWYYRQFGYEYALELGGGRASYKPQLPTLKEGEDETFQFREAAEDDIPFLMELYEHRAKRSLLACVRDEAIWRYELTAQGNTDVQHNATVIIAAGDGTPVGYVRHAPRLWGTFLSVADYELRPDTSWLDATPSVIRYLWSKGEGYAAQSNKEMGNLGLRLGTEHPAYVAFNSRLPQRLSTYAWYIRVPDVPRFLMHIAPVLEARLAASVLEGYTGDLRISNYRSGIHLAFEKGKLARSEAYRPAFTEDGHAFFPDLTFIQVLFGYRNLDELLYAYPDCWAQGDAPAALLNVLFPKQPSHLLPVA